MTNAEKEIDKKLRNDLKQRREEGENVMIKNGEIVRKPRTTNLGDYIEKNREVQNKQYEESFPQMKVSSYRGRGGRYRAM